MKTRVLNLIVMLLLCGTAKAADMTVFAAASLKTALDEIATLWSASHSEEIVLSYAGSAALANQIKAGAPADIFISANRDWMAYLEENALIKPETVEPLLSNSLVLVAHEPSPAITADEIVPKIGSDYLAMGFVDSVPAGIYGKAALEHFKIWDHLLPNIVQTENVRAALALTALGEAPYAIIYGSDAIAEPKVHQIFEFPEESHPVIEYLMAQPSSSASVDASAFMGFLKTEAATKIFEKNGFRKME